MKVINSIKRMFSWQSIRFAITGLLVSVLAVTTIACSQTTSNAPQTPNPSTAGQGMYPHEDTERDTRAADLKTRRAVRKAEEKRQNIQSPEDYFEEVKPGKKIKRGAEKVGESAQDAAERANQAAQRAANEANQSAQQASNQVNESAQQAANEVSNSTQRAVRNAAQNTQDSFQELKENAQDAVEQAANKVDQAT